MELLNCEHSNWICIVLGSVMFATHNVRSASFSWATESLWFRQSSVFAPFVKLQMLCKQRMPCSYISGYPVLGRVRVVMKSVYNPLQVCPSVSVRLHFGRSPWSLVLGLLWKSVEISKICLKSAKIAGYFTCRSKYVSLLPATLNHH